MLVTPQIAAHVFAGFVSQSPPWLDRTSGVISVNTQARRLGCLIYLLGQVAEGNKLESLLMSLPSEDIAALKQNLAENGLTSGYLTARPSSVKHYLDLAIELRLLVRQGAVLSLTTRGRFLLDAVRPKRRTPYPLSRAARVFFLDALLRTDYFGMTAVVRSLLSGARKMRTIQSEHRSQVIRLLTEVAQRSSSARITRFAQDRMISIQNWKKPESYSEHLVSAKLNWLADLGLLVAAPSAKSEVLISSPHEGWLSSLSGAADPTESQLLALVLNYCLVEHTAQPNVSSADICAALEAAFERLTTPGPLMKIRCNDFLLFLLCFHPSLLANSILKARPLLADPGIPCGDRLYQPHFASRSTQSFIVLQHRTER